MNSTRRTNTRNTVANPRPVFVSQYLFWILGFKTPRAFLEWLPVSGCRVVDRGKDRLVLLDEAEAALLRMANTGALETVPANAAAVTADKILASIGRRATGAR